MPQASPRPWCVPIAGGLRLAVRLQPGARKAGLGGPVTLADGAAALSVRVTAAPEGGKANTALIALLAKTWLLPKGSFKIVAGRSTRDKALVIAGDSAHLEAKLKAWLRDREADERS